MKQIIFLRTDSIYVYFRFAGSFQTLLCTHLSYKNLNQ